MRRTKTILASACALVLAVALAGCAASGSTSTSESSGSASQATSRSAASSQAASSEASASSQASSASSQAATTASLAPGTYSAKFQTDNSMFHVNEALNDLGELTVAEDGSMVIHVSLQSKKIVNLYVGTAKEAENDEAGQLQPTTDSVTYSDGTTEEVYGFDIPVPALDEEFDCALLGEKGKWYDHKVIVSDPESK